MNEELIICFVGKRRVTDKKSGREKLVQAMAPVRRVNGSRILILASDAVQKKGFQNADADFLLKHYPREFKVKQGR